MVGVEYYGDNGFSNWTSQHAPLQIFSGKIKVLTSNFQSIPSYSVPHLYPSGAHHSRGLYLIRDTSIPLLACPSGIRGNNINININNSKNLPTSTDGSLLLLSVRGL
jgi:hypothetical protein